MSEAMMNIEAVAHMSGQLDKALQRITELEASLADAIEAQQVLGLKLEQAEAENARLKKMHKAQSEQIGRLQDTVQSLKENTNESANTVGEREACPACGDDVEHVWCLISPEGKRFTGDTKMAAYRAETSSRVPSTEQLENIMRANAECEAEYQADLEQARKQGYQSGYAAGLEVNSANTVGDPTPVMDAAPACEPERSVSESIAAGHPCFDPDGPPDHDWKYVDDSFAHEFGTEICGHYECARCDASKPE